MRNFIFPLLLGLLACNQTGTDFGANNQEETPEAEPTPERESDSDDQDQGRNRPPRGDRPEPTPEPDTRPEPVPDDEVNEEPEGFTFDRSVLDTDPSDAYTLDELAHMGGARGVVVTVIEGLVPTALPITIGNEPLLAFTAPEYVVHAYTNNARDARWNQVGLAHGMSGSPCYAPDENGNWRLIGALAYGFDQGESGPWSFEITPAVLMHETAARLSVGDGRRSLLTLSGLGTASQAQGALAELREEFSALAHEQGQTLTHGPSGRTHPRDMTVPMEAGSSLAALLLTGDLLQVGAIGTVTWVKDSELAAFGHPFFLDGAVSWPLSHASVTGSGYNVFEGYFKVAAPAGDVLGVILEDRTTGIFGAVDGRVAQGSISFETHTCVRRTCQQHNHMLAESLYTYYLLPEPVFTPALIAIDGDLPKTVVGEITFTFTVDEEVRFVSVRNVLGPEPFQENPFWALVDRWIYRVLFAAADLHLSGAAQISVVETSIELIDQEQRYAVTQAELPETVRQGEILRTTLTIDVGEEGEIRRPVNLTVPADFPLGDALLRVSTRDPSTPVGVDTYCFDQDGLDVDCVLDGIERSSSPVGYWVTLESGGQELECECLDEDCIFCRERESEPVRVSTFVSPTRPNQALRELDLRQGVEILPRP